ncbi:Calcium-dependent protein kinase 15 [Pelomyxa schiedti]|nr:Calcium-dependent protein kinase 15 [Pelomyxa schiedti]
MGDPSSHTATAASEEPSSPAPTPAMESAVTTPATAITAAKRDRDHLTRSMLTASSVGDYYYDDDDDGGGGGGGGVADDDDYDDEVDGFLTDSTTTQHRAGGAPPNMNPDINPNLVDMSKCFLPPPEEVQAVGCLNKCQEQAMAYVVSRAKPLSEAAKTPLIPRLARISKQDSGEDALQKVLRYIRDDAPIIVHFNVDKVMNFFSKDTHYRNQFETKTSGGWYEAGHSRRMEWEDRIFNRTYPHDCPGFDRPKYGVLNMVNDLNGVRCCSSYGDSFLVLRRVRLRTSFANADTSQSSVQISSCEWYAHVLQQYNDVEISATLSVAEDPLKIHKDSSCIYSYKEVQVHGPVAFKDHVAGAVINIRHKTNATVMKTIKTWADENGFPFVFTGEPLPAVATTQAVSPSRRLITPSGGGTTSTTSGSGTATSNKESTEKTAPPKTTTATEASSTTAPKQKHHCIIL